eukprot:TRINITY_DN5322_c0_g2_i4.p1 TRINITY_DN5322_c0_g2~~TRINITY_DN5322_c0_g2_i4.p1  ORF type:complete len:637 (-),score=159.56 TRINITY_DN5322_c0_g2_i4:28-1938(-)
MPVVNHCLLHSFSLYRPSSVHERGKPQIDKSARNLSLLDLHSFEKEHASNRPGSARDKKSTLVRLQSQIMKRQMSNRSLQDDGNGEGFEMEFDGEETTEEEEEIEQIEDSEDGEKKTERKPKEGSFQTDGEEANSEKKRLSHSLTTKRAFSSPFSTIATAANAATAATTAIVTTAANAATVATVVTANAVTAATVATAASAASAATAATVVTANTVVNAATVATAATAATAASVATAATAAGVATAATAAGVANVATAATTAGVANVTTAATAAAVTAATVSSVATFSNVTNATTVTNAVTGNPVHPTSSNLKLKIQGHDSLLLGNATSTQSPSASLTPSNSGTSLKLHQRHSKGTFDPESSSPRSTSPTRRSRASGPAVPKKSSNLRSDTSSAVSPRRMYRRSGNYADCELSEEQSEVSPTDANNSDENTESTEQDTGIKPRRSSHRFKKYKGCETKTTGPTYDISRRPSSKCIQTSEQPFEQSQEQLKSESEHSENSKEQKPSEKIKFELPPPPPPPPQLPSKRSSQSGLSFHQSQSSSWEQYKNVGQVPLSTLHRLCQQEDLSETTYKKVISNLFQNLDTEQKSHFQSFVTDSNKLEVAKVATILLLIQSHTKGEKEYQDTLQFVSKLGTSHS